MFARTVFAIMFLCSIAAIPALAQDEALVSFSGRVLADRRPVDWTVEIRLEREDASLITTAYTRGTDYFKFHQVFLRRNESSYLVIKEPGYRELKYAFDFFDLRQDPISGMYYRANIIILELQKLPEEKKADISEGPKTVDFRQILPKEAQQEYDLALEELATGNDEAAVKHLEKVVQLAPENHDSINKLGAMYIKVGQFEKAEETLTRARTLDPRNLTTLTNLGILYLQKGDKLESPDDELSDLGLELGKDSYLKAAEVFEEALQLDPEAPRSCFYLGTALYKTGEYEKAESLLSKALALDPQLEDARLSLLNVYISQRRYDDALDQIALFLKENPDSPQRKQVEKYKVQIEEVMHQ